MKTAGPPPEFSQHAEKLTNKLSPAVFVGDVLRVARDELAGGERLGPDVFGPS